MAKRGRPKKSSNKTITVGKIPGAVKDILINGEEVTIEDALEMAEMDCEGYEVRLNGDVTEDLDTVLDDGDEIVLVKRVKGAN